MVIFAAAESQLSCKIAFGLADRSIEVLQHIALRGTSWPESCIVAIRNLVAQLERSRKGSINASSCNLPVTPRRATSPPNQTYLGNLNRTQGPQNTAPSAAFAATTTGDVEPQSLSRNPNSNSFGELGAALQSATSQYPFDIAGNYFNGSSNFLGIAQQSSDIPRALEDITQLFSSEDMTRWMGPDYGFDRLL
ncbi:hypothetical protein BDU57DRAFT_593694 [Ampelomyces quisqualis]|uniref:Transcription factor domain-containing protein n=1 Tax=Ampelomyces quisqualis TaxID=50730 RepID=A0A6A5QPB2_AMPQU|nr:hypothetical protein BDU57DRAFT_593694 [Ampelomyces quisqualis]